MNWKSVDTAKPDNYSTVICFDGCSVYACDYSEIDGFHNEYGSLNDHITHWMEMPEPPKYLVGV
ncbi:MAG: DUF551 domain-containing protein [Gammaproteobacteria bacterium]|nr:DUF551 domain-containing protein [Gammaproteobacteria bacterium]